MPVQQVKLLPGLQRRQAAAVLLVLAGSVLVTSCALAILVPEAVARLACTLLAVADALPAYQHGRRFDTLPSLTLAIRGVVYDVSSRSDLYGPGKVYAGFVQTDCAGMLAHGSTQDTDPRLLTVGREDWRRLAEWEALYAQRYPSVGWHAPTIHLQCMEPGSIISFVYRAATSYLRIAS